VTCRDAGADGATGLQPPVPVLDLEAALPPALASACNAVACWIQIAPEAVATCMLAHTSAAIGNTRWVEVRGLRVPVSVHFVTSLPAGSGKSVIRSYLRRATAAIEDKIVARREQAAREVQAYADELDEWRAARKSAKGREAAGPRPEPPPPSPLGGPRVTYCLSEANLEGLIETLRDSPRGVLWSTDEAHEVVGMLGGYGEGRRSLDAARLRRLMDSGPIEAHRARSNASPLRRLRLPFVALDFDVQPGVLRALFAPEDKISGFAARLPVHEPRALQGERRYMTPPPEPGPEVLAVFTQTLEALFGLPLELDENGTPRPSYLRLEPEAETLWAEELEHLEALYASADDERAGVLGHARGRILRLAGVLCLMRDPAARAVRRLDAARAIVWTRYFLAHGERLAKLGAESTADRERRTLLEWVERHGADGATVREVTRGPRRFRGAPEAARAALEELVGLGELEGLWPAPDGTGGRPTRRYRLIRPEGARRTADGGDGDETPPGVSGSVGFVAVAAPPCPGSTAGDTEPEPGPGPELAAEGAALDAAGGTPEELAEDRVERAAIRAEGAAPGELLLFGLPASEWGDPG